MMHDSDQRLYHPRFTSFAGFRERLAELFRTLKNDRKAILALDPAFRETVALTVTFANNCAF